MGEQWYWKHRGETLGPLDTGELERLVQHHRVFDRDEIRLAGSDEWLSAADVKAMFAQHEDEATSEAASRLLDQAAHRQLHLPVEGSSHRRLAFLTDTIGTSGTAIVRTVKEASDGILGHISDGFAWILSLLAPLMNRKLGVAVLIVGVTALILTKTDFGGFENRRTYDKLSAAYEQMQTLHATEELSPKQWQEFQDQTRAWLKPTIASLEEDGPATSLEPTPLLARQQVDGLGTRLAAGRSQGDGQYVVTIANNRNQELAIPIWHGRGELLHDR